jgi:hypothetical protein
VTFLPADILRVLVEHDVQFILVGGVAARVHGAPVVTADVDVEATLEESGQ